MPYTKHKAIIIGRTLKGDCDKNLLLVLEDGKKIQATIRKARDSSSKWACVTEPVCLVDIELYQRKNKNTIVSIRLETYFTNIAKNLSSAVAQEMIFELINDVFPLDVPENLLFENLKQAYQLLNDSTQNHLSVLSWFMNSFLLNTGYQLSLNFCPVCGENITSDSFFDIKKGCAICKVCTTKGNIPLPDFARKALSALEHVNPVGLSFDSRLSKGIIELLIRIIKNRFDVSLKTSLHIKSL